jgi:hypothetical protein
MSPKVLPQRLKSSAHWDSTPWPEGEGREVLGNQTAWRLEVRCGEVLELDNLNE